MVLLSLSFLSLNIINAFSPTDVNVNHSGVISTENHIVCLPVLENFDTEECEDASSDPARSAGSVHDAGCTLHSALRYKYLQNKESKKEQNLFEPTHSLIMPCQLSAEDDSQMQLLIISWPYYLNMNAY